MVAKGKLNHLGMRGAPSRNGLNHQNKRRNWHVFRDIYMELYKELGQQTYRKHELQTRINRKIFLLDSSTVTLCMSLYDWAHYTHEKGAIKMHTLLDFEGLLPHYMYISDGKMPDNMGAYRVFPPKNSVTVSDRGYCDSELWKDWDSNGVQLAVRLRKDILYSSLGEMMQPDEIEQMILKDEAIELQGIVPSKNYPRPLRRVAVWDPKNKKCIELVCNNGEWSAQVIADLYKARWEIETFFKTIKQNLRVKTFLGITENAVMCQIWRAMIAILLLRYLKAKATLPWHMSELVAFLRVCLFMNIDLWLWLNDPFEQGRKKPPDCEQGVLF